MTVSRIRLTRLRSDKRPVRTAKILSIATDRSIVTIPSLGTYRAGNFGI